MSIDKIANIQPESSRTAAKHLRADWRGGEVW